MKGNPGEVFMAEQAAGELTFAGQIFREDLIITSFVI
jgi:hypothetical protein